MFQLDARARPALLLDEAQQIPSLFSALRGAIDADRQKSGRFIILETPVERSFSLEAPVKTTADRIPATRRIDDAVTSPSLVGPAASDGR